ncbi:polyketide cyclase [Neorhizobium lilium]|uniref:Polyketide cyclase n=1 Tax=Neorhizobium lilium TaxID=2503024 RepID=A0A3S3VP39_9HYPH|nr:SRPBCC family protein [Neorhizobium lilium]RWX78706.1 polyketide cyclase [Neorhizobium lilium]
MLTSEATTHSLQIIRELEATADQLFKAWTTPERMGEWFCPKPWRVTEARLDVRPGGSSFILMEGPNGEKVPNRGVYLDVVPGRKLVFTDAYTSAWVPSEKPFMTGIIEFEDLGSGRTLYTATALHWSEEDRETHDKMGFEEGWGIVATQLEAVARTF